MVFIGYQYIAVRENLRYVFVPAACERRRADHVKRRPRNEVHTITIYPTSVAVVLCGR